ncbi:MAG TPA: hypothetical protein IAA10_02510 [Candidatus Blautia intestinavium]|nr:hypothetical protein [Candidatus Blautia intestinavium]
MDTPTIAAYYREADPMKRKQLLDQSEAAGEEPEANKIRREIWEARYHEKGENGSLADGFLKLWMAMEFNRNSGNRWFTGSRGARKEIGKELAAVKFHEIRQKSGLHEQLLYRECCHLVDLYMNLCSHDKSYNTIICGIITISKDSAKAKLQKDIYETAVRLPGELNMQEELGLITKAAREIYEIQFPGEGGLPE